MTSRSNMPGQGSTESTARPGPPPSVGRTRLRILGCFVDNLTMEETVGIVDGFVRSREPHQHVVINVDKVVKAHRDPTLRSIVNACDLINADGMPIVWASYLLGTPLKERVTGIDLFEKLIETAAARGWRVYLLGAREQVLTRTVSVLQDRHPGLLVAGYRDGYWNPEEETQVVAAIGAVKPDLLFVAISSPRKEEFLGRYQRELQIPFAMGVGGTFDVVSGLTRRAPRWMRAAGLEWFFRFLQEPRRMFRRYFVEDMYFFWILARELLARRSRRSP